MGPVRIAFVLPYGERSDGFFPDTFAGQLCTEARAAGHTARIVRVYYDGDGGARDRAVADRLEAWLDEGAYELVVLERVFDLAPIRAFTARAPDRRCVLVVRGDSIEPAPGIDLVVGAVRGATRTGRTRRAVTLWQIADAFAALVARIAAGVDLAGVPGVARVDDGVLGPAAPLADEVGPRRSLAPTLAHDVIALGEPPPVLRRTLFGNAGCPYAADPRGLPLYRDLALPDDVEVARLGCTFCSMGGDYERRADAEVIGSLVAQARHVMTHAPETRELVLDDQAALRYLGPLVRAAAAAGVPPVRWLFAARSDTFVRERARVDDAIAAAAATGHTVELYLTGFEAFCDAELLRYGKGVTVADQLAAIDAMRARAAAHPDAFRYADARGHSLILWSPWTTPDDVAATVEVIRRHGLTELFDELGRNRLRLYPDLPIHHAAARDGALVDAWDDGDRGAGRRKGYHVERPWRFLDPRTRLAYQLAGAVRARLGTATEAAQLRAIALHARGWRGDAAAVGAEVARIEAELDALIARLTWRERGPGDPPRGRQRRAAVVRATGACNDGCPSCPNRDRYLPDDRDALRARIAAARSDGRPLMFAGREPTLRGDLGELLIAARGPDGRDTGLVSNGRRFAVAGFAEAALRAGLTAASIKLFAAEAATADAIARVDGAHAQALAGCRALHRLGLALEVRAPADAANLATLPALAEVARAVGADQLRVEAAIDAVGLGQLAEAAAAIDRLLARCAALGLPAEVSPLDAGTTLCDWLPTRVLPSTAR